MNTSQLKTSVSALRANVFTAFGGVEVDEEAGVIRNAAIITKGDAQGHGFVIDDTTLQQVADLINASPDGIKCRFRHPKELPDGTHEEALGTQVAHIPPTVRIEGDSVRGDVHFGNYASAVPGLGDVRSYLLSLAKERPQDFGLSAVIEWSAETQEDGEGNVTVYARVGNVQAADLVERPAANPRGLLASKPHSNTKDIPMEYDKKMVPALKKLGLAEEDDPREFFKKLNEEEIEELKSLLEENKDEEEQLADDEEEDLADDEEKDSFEGSSDEEEKKASTKAKLSARNRRNQLITNEGDKVLAAEGKRVAQLQQLGGVLKIPQEVISKAIADNLNIVDAKNAYLKHLSDTWKPIRSVRIGEDRNRSSLAAAIPDAIMLRAGMTIDKPHARADQLRQQTVLDMFRHYLASLGIPADKVFGMGRVRLAELLGPRRFRQAFPQFAQLAQSTSDFDAILENTMRKILRKEYTEFPTTWSRWAQRATTPDFKPVSRPQLSLAPDLVARNEGGEIKYATITDSKETYALVEYVSGIKLTRQALINDDLSAFTRIPRNQGQAAKRLEDRLAYGVLNANGKLSDGVDLFHSSHKNLVSGTGKVGAPSTVAVLDATNRLLRKQTGLGGVGKLNLSAKYLLVPASLEVIAQQFISSAVDPSKQNQVPNPFAGKMEVIATPFLDADEGGSDTAWYLVSDMIETVEVCFLSDEPEPVLRQETDFDTEDAKFAVRHTVAAAAIEHRGLVKNPGA